MKTLKTLAVALFSVLLLNACSQNNSESLDELQKEVSAVFAETIKLFEKKDATGLANRFAERAALKFPDQPLLVGKDAIKKHYINSMQADDFQLKLVIIDMDFSGCNEIAWVTNMYEVSFMTPDGLFTDRGNSLVVLRKIKGKWKIVAESLSSTA